MIMKRFPFFFLSSPIDNRNNKQMRRSERAQKTHKEKERKDYNGRRNESLLDLDHSPKTPKPEEEPGAQKPQ